MRWCLIIRSDTRFCGAVLGSAGCYGGCWVVNDTAGAYNFHMWALRHNRRFQSRDVVNTIDCSIVGT